MYLVTYHLWSESHPPPPSSAELAHTCNIQWVSLFYLHVLPGIHIWTCSIPKGQHAHGAVTYLFNCTFNPCLHTRDTTHWELYFFEVLEDVLPEYVHFCLQRHVSCPTDDDASDGQGKDASEAQRTLLLRLQCAHSGRWRQECFNEVQRSQQSRWSMVPLLIIPEMTSMTDNLHTLCFSLTLEPPWGKIYQLLFFNWTLSFFHTLFKYPGLWLFLKSVASPKV